MAKPRIKAPYLEWQPVLKAEDVYKGVISFSYLQADGANQVYWVEQRPDEGGRSVLVQQDAHGKIRDLTPKAYSARTRAFEYGSYPYTVHGPWVYFANFADQRLYRQSLEDPSAVIPLTPATNQDGSLGKYADLAVSPDGNWLIFAYEKEPKSGECRNLVGLLDLRKEELQEPVVLAKGADFYKSPKFSPDGKQIAWLEWNHPYMPWDSTRLFAADFSEGRLKPESITKVAGSDDSSIPNFTFGPGGELFYAVDFAKRSEKSPENFYNIHGFKAGKDRVLTRSLDDCYYLRSQGSKLLCLRWVKGQSRLLLLDPENGQEQRYAEGYADLAMPVACPDGNLFVIGYPADRPSELLKIRPSGEIQVQKRSAAFPIQSTEVSRGEAIEFPTEDGDTCHGYFYPPLNTGYEPMPDERPPVRVLVHGGPVGMTTPAFSLAKLFWTSQGYAIFDVNYRGSMGFGRRYRDALRHKWGMVEIQDVKDGLDFLRKSGQISGRAVVSGGSAGGYTVQRLLTYYPDLFAAGASHFGIGNLVTLQKLTHKYESHYLEQLIGGTLETNLKEYHDRSPINHLDRLKAPMIIFQGAEDKVVPPENSREMARILAAKGIEHEYHEFPDEAHGFRKKENLVDALEKESRFFKRVLALGGKAKN